MILGTAAYMSPEQAKGAPADKRSDVWAFGCVFYEMLTGRRAFQGEDVSDTLATVLKGEPDWNALPSNVPAAVRALIQGCLRKDRKERIGDISTALFLLGQPHAVAAGCTGQPAAPPPVWRRAMLVAAGVLIGAAIAAAMLWTREPSPARPGDPIRVHAAAGTTVDRESTSRRHVAGRHTHGVRRRWPAVSPVHVGSRGQGDTRNRRGRRARCFRPTVNRWCSGPIRRSSELPSAAARP